MRQQFTPESNNVMYVWEQVEQNNKSFKASVLIENNFIGWHSIKKQLKQIIFLGTNLLSA